MKENKGLAETNLSTQAFGIQTTSCMQHEASFSRVVINNLNTAQRCRALAPAIGDEKLTRAPRETFVSSTHKHHVRLNTEALTHSRVRHRHANSAPCLLLLAVAAATMAICFYCFPDKIFSTAEPFRRPYLSNI